MIIHYCNGGKVWYFWDDYWSCPDCSEENKMACVCKNPDGTLAETCNGLCQSKVVDNEKQRLIDMNISVLKEVQQLRNQIASFAQQVAGLSNTMIEANRNGFKEGFKEGFDLAREVYE